MSSSEQTLLEEAIEWMAQIQSGSFDEHQQQALEQWRNQSPEHARVFDRLLAGLASVQASPWRGRHSEPLLRAIEEPFSRRRFIGNSLALSGVLLGAGLFARWMQAGMGLPGELVTATGERRRWQLDDGSHLELNARSRVVPKFDDRYRGLQLRRGTLLVEVAEQNLPLEIATAHGAVHSQAGQVQVGEEGDGIRLLTLRGEALLHLPGGARIAVPGAHSLLFDGQGVKQRETLQPGEGSWASGWLEVHDKPLGWVIEAFRPYLPGIVVIDEATARVRVNGLFPLDNMNVSLDMLSRSLPVEVVRHSDYWVRIKTVTG
ncbi:FecR family protein [Pseudomonas sp. 21LCFQ02]|uniref:FecR family protein n=1 Tax=Pseudomonas sp. 21LCFQ02 TaxID=2957505 RepID=UPI00209A9563|nr:FecR family protein [Pseudomonas sp. 21LCFQ02]MCO8167142.1 FecR family protein [Pseudomonas sp. 21LCFQ02]